MAQDNLDDRTLSGSGKLNIKPMVPWRKEAWRGREKGRGSAVDWRFDAGQFDLEAGGMDELLNPVQIRREMNANSIGVEDAVFREY